MFDALKNKQKLVHPSWLRKQYSGYVCMSNKGGGPALGEAELELVSEGGVERVKRLRRATQDAAQQRLLRCIYTTRRREEQKNSNSTNSMVYIPCRDADSMKRSVRSGHSSHW